MNGWIKISRHITEMDGYFGEKFNKPMCWIDLLILAEWRAEKVFYVRGNKVTVKRGQIAISLNDLRERWKLSTRTIRRWLQYFEDEGMITTQKSNIITLISIVNYEKYQGSAMQNNDATEDGTDCTTPNTTRNTTQKPKGNARKSTGYDEQNSKSTTQNATDSTTQSDTQSDTPIKNNKNIYITAINSCLSETSSDTPKIDVERFIIFFNSEMEKAGASIPRARSISSQRLAMLTARCREYGKEAVCEAIRKAARSKFLNGGGNRGFIADFTWIFRPNNFPRVLEGFYDNTQIQQNNGNNKQNDQAKRRRFEVEASSSKDYKTSF